MALATSADPPGSGSTGYGSLASCAITEDGKLYCWGILSWLVGNGAALQSPYAQAITIDGVEPLVGVTQAAHNRGGACAVRVGTAGNELLCWGIYGNVAQGDTTKAQYPARVVGLTNPTRTALSTTLSTGTHTACVVDAGSVHCWGLASSSGSGTFSGVLMTPTLVKTGDGAAALSGVIDLVSGDNGFCALREEASMWCWHGGTYASNYGVPNVADLGCAAPTFATKDGKYHAGQQIITPNCDEL